MKKKFLFIAKKYRVEILEYKSKRSDMGVQMFKIKLKNRNNTIWYHEDGYYVGQLDGRENLLEDFNKILQNLI